MGDWRRPQGRVGDDAGANDTLARSGLAEDPRAIRRLSCLHVRTTLHTLHLFRAPVERTTTFAFLRKPRSCCHVCVFVNGRPMAISPHVHGNQAATLEVKYDSDGLHIRIGGHIYLDGVPVPGWNPQPDWSIGFGGFSEVTSDDFWGIDHVDMLSWTVERGSNVWPTDARLQVSLNGQQIAVDDLIFSRQHETVVTSVMPSSGPVVGGSQVTLTGTNLQGGDHYQCRFGTVVVEALFVDRYTVTCESPLNCAGNLALQVTLNAQQYAPGVPYMVRRNVLQTPDTCTDLSLRDAFEVCCLSLFVSSRRVHTVLRWRRLHRDRRPRRADQPEWGG